MQTTADTPILKCDNLLVSARGITETHARKIIVFVPASDIDHITLKFGRSDHHPILSLTLGIILSLVGAFGLTKLILAPRGFRYELGMMMLGAIGGSMIFDTLKQRYFLEVAKKQGVCRLVFSKRAQLEDIRDFCHQVTVIYKYQISDEV